MPTISDSHPVFPPASNVPCPPFLYYLFVAVVEPFDPARFRPDKDKLLPAAGRIVSCTRAETPQLGRELARAFNRARLGRPKLSRRRWLPAQSRWAVFLCWRNPAAVGDTYMPPRRRSRSPQPLPHP